LGGGNCSLICRDRMRMAWACAWRLLKVLEPYRVWGSHSSRYEEFWFLGYNAVQSTSRRNVCQARGSNLCFTITCSSLQRRWCVFAALLLRLVLQLWIWRRHVLRKRWLNVFVLELGWFLVSVSKYWQNLFVTTRHLKCFGPKIHMLVGRLSSYMSIFWFPVVRKAGLRNHCNEWRWVPSFSCWANWLIFTKFIRTLCHWKPPRRNLFLESVMTTRRTDLQICGAGAPLTQP
jgi:hypothetical protein